jgi:hypothetical protein
MRTLRAEFDDGDAAKCAVTERVNNFLPQLLAIRAENRNLSVSADVELTVKNSLAMCGISGFVLKSPR